MSTEAAMVKLDGPAERWENRRQWLPPRWCADCEAGCSLDNCWWCGQPTTALKDRAMRNGHGTPASFSWGPEAEPER